MKDKQEYDNGRQLHIEDYLQENKLETESIVEVPNVLDVSSKRKVDTKTWSLFLYIKEKYLTF